MILTFPHMGKAYIPIKALLDDLNMDMVIPPPITKKTLESGTMVSPETACLPLKINMGNYIESISQGADTILLSGSCGPCRFGYYGVVQKEILKDMGYTVDIVIFDPPRRDLAAFFSRIKGIVGSNSWLSVSKAVKRAFHVAEAADSFYDMALKKRCRERNMGDTDRMLKEYETQILGAKGSHEILKVIDKFKAELESITEYDGYYPLRVGLVGEIYTLIEPYVNLQIEKRLGLMGVELYRGITINDWIKYHLSFDIRFKLTERRILKKAKPYLGLCIGGHAWQTIANALYFAQSGLDGVIQLMPFGCMPEIVAESILPSIAEDMDIPIMTLVVDEMTGEAGYQTRLEAFVDLIDRRRKGKKNEKRQVLFRH